jgi:hypothetical protein
MSKKGLTNREMMILSALRYSLYRRSYIPGVCRNELRREVEEGNLSQRAIAQAIHEIYECEKEYNNSIFFLQKRLPTVKDEMIEDWYQKAEWIELRNWLREKLIEEKQIQWLKQVGDEL